MLLKKMSADLSCGERFKCSTTCISGDEHLMVAGQAEGSLKALEPWWCLRLVEPEFSSLDSSSVETDQGPSSERQPAAARMIDIKDVVRLSFVRNSRCM
jgi:hypothetical protein